MKAAMLDPNVHKALLEISTATITTLLFKKGLRNVWIRSARHQCGSSPRVAGVAFTMRFIAGREDLSNPEAWSSAKSTRACVEAMPSGCIVVAGAADAQDAGILGDILCARMGAKGVAGLVTDGAVRDIAGIRSSNLCVWASGIAAPPAIVSVHFVGWEEPISCGGVAVFPGDIIVADGDGAVVIPPPYLDDILKDGQAQEDLETWTLKEVLGGHQLTGLYPLNEENRCRFEQSRA